MLKRTIALLLLLCTLLGTSLFAVSCKKTEQEEGESTNDVSASEETHYLDTVKSYDGGGRDFNIMVTTQLEPFYIQEEMSDSLVDNACYTRNKEVEDRYNVKLSYTALDGNGSGATAFATAVRTSAAAGSDPFEIVVGQQYYCLPLATESLYHNLLDSTVINWDADWYHSYINNVGTINGKLYGASGDFVISQYSYAMALLYNKNIYAKQGFTEDLYQTVRDGKWTFEKFETIVTTFEDDLGTEYIGMVHDDHNLQATVIGCGIDFATKNSDGQWTADEFYTDELEEKYAALRALFNDCVTVPKADDKNISKVNTTLFYGRYVHDLIVDEKLKSTEFSVGVLPFPKYDESQKDYRTYTMRGELFYVPINADLEQSSILLEALNYETGELVVPEYWDTALELRGSDTSDDLEMLELISQNFYYDFAKYFEADMYGFNWSITSTIQKNQATFSTWWGSNSRSLNRYIEKINENYGGE